jgi:large subunit ribosomal protein L35e
LTVIRHTDRAAVKLSLAGKKHLPKDMRAKKTRAIRRQLTKFEASRETVRQHKKTILNKVRKYAIKA